MIRLLIVTYLSERDSTVLVLVHFLDDLRRFLIADVEAARLNEAPKFFAGDCSRVVHVEGVESLIDVKVGLTLEVLADGFGRDLGAEVLAPDGLELKAGVGHEAVIAAVQRVAMVGSATLSHAGVVSVEGDEGIREFTHVETTITSSVVASHEEIELLAGGEDTDGGETLTQVNSGDATEVPLVEDLERVRQVEVGLESQARLLALNIVLILDHGPEAVDELVLVAQGQHRLPGWAGVAGQGLGGDASGRARAVRGGRAERRRVTGGAHGTRGRGRAQRARSSAGEEAATVTLSRSGTLGSIHGSAARRAGRADELSEFGVRKLSITIGVHAADDSKKLSLAGVVADGPEEGAEVEGIDASIVVSVDAAVGGEGGEIVANLKLALQNVKATHEVDLLLEDVEEGALDVVGKRVEATDTVGGSVQGDIPQKVVRAGQEHLQEA